MHKSNAVTKIKNTRYSITKGNECVLNALKIGLQVHIVLWPAFGAVYSVYSYDAECWGLIARNEELLFQRKIIRSPKPSANTEQMYQSLKIVPLTAPVEITYPRAEFEASNSARGDAHRKSPSQRQRDKFKVQIFRGNQPLRDAKP
jgi:hypothetical protein